MLVAAAAYAGDPSGTWTWTQAGRNGGADRTNSLVLKYADSKLTGKLTPPARGGADVVPIEITEGKVDGDTVSFNVVMEFNGNSMTNKYSGTLAGDKITGKIMGGRGGRGGGGGGNGGGGGGGNGGGAGGAGGAGGGAGQGRPWEATRSK